MSPLGITAKNCRVIQHSKRLDLLQLMIDAQNTIASATNLKSLIAGDDAEAVESDGKMKTAKSANNPTECPFAAKTRGLTHDEVIDNAFLVLLAGFV